MLALTVVPLCAIIDLDGDGISDLWTARHEVTSAADADPDGDGLSNREEACAGTNPTDAEDHLSTTIRTTADKKMELSWPSVFGKRYRIETSADLKAWTEFRSQLTGTGKRFSEALGEASLATSPNFWRVAVDDIDSDSDGITDWEEAQLRTSPTNPDTDGDGMVDGDEYRWFGGFSYDGTGNSDGDGETDATELANGTSPYDPYNGAAPPPPPAGFTDAIPPKGKSTTLAPTSWCFFILPDDYELVAKSVSGVAVLKRTSSNDGLTVNSYYRWDLGSIDELGAHNSAVINRRGTIAMRTGIQASPYQRIPAANVWPRRQTTPWVYIPPFVSASGYNWWYEEYWSTRWNHIDLIAIDDNNTIWYETLGGYDNTRGYGYYYNAAAAPYGGTQEIHPQFIRFGAPDNGSRHFSIIVSASGTPYGWETTGDYPSTATCYVGDQAVETLPYINENETRLWYDRAEIEFADGHTEPTPADGTVWYLDSSDRPHGEADGHDVMWTKRSATSDIPSSPVEYTRHDYVALPSMNGWVTDIMVAPDSDEPVSGTATHPTLGTHNFLAFPVHAYLAVDANRDGEIMLPSEDDSDATSADKPSRFWINDDIDRGHTVDKTDFEEDDLSLKEAGAIAGCKTADWQNNQILAKRDLEDFARLWISMQGLSAAFLPKGSDDNAEADLYMGLQWSDTTGTPAIKIYPAAETDGGAKYLTDETVAADQIGLDYAMKDFRDPTEQVRSAMNVVQGTDFFVIPPRYFGRFTEANPKTCFLFEGVTAGKGQLKLVILKKEGGAFTKIGEGPGVWMDLKKVDEFYERWTVGDTGGGAPWSAALRKRVTLDSQSTFTGHSDGFAYASDALEEMKYILYVHGWNMEPWEKNRYAETMFKRLYWQGYKGRFGVFCWPTAYGFDGPLSLIRDGTNYDRSEWAAWRAAMPLKNLLVSLHTTYGNQVHVLAHSMGNVATGEALELAALAGTGKIVATYVATQAAITAHCYDGAQPDNLQPEPFGGAIARSWDGAWPQTPNIYKDWLTGNGAAATTRVNFYNVNDYALWHDLWEANQYFKPDGVDLPDQPYTYKFYHDPEGSNPDNFAKLDGTMHPLTLGDRYTLHDRYEIMSFAAEARCRAVGATPSSLTLGDSLDLQSIWPADNGIKLHEDVQPGGLAFSAHRWHSAQFRSTNMRQQRYWKALLGSRGFQLITTP